MAGVVVVVGAVFAGVVMAVNMLVGPVVVMVRVLVEMRMAVGMGMLVAVRLPVVRVFVDVGVLVFVIMLMLMGVFAFHDGLLLFFRFTASTSPRVAFPAEAGNSSRRPCCGYRIPAAEMSLSGKCRHNS